jgi:hypothetical protein
MRVDCPKHTSVLGGGESAQAALGQLELRQTYPADGSDQNHKLGDAWVVLVRNGAGPKATVKASAACGNADVTYATKSLTVLANTEQDTACPAGLFAYSGGISSSSRQLHVDSEFPLTEVANTEWSGYYYASSQIAATGYAVCLGTSPEITTKDVSTISENHFAETAARCPKSKRVYGAGISTNAGLQFHTLTEATTEGSPKPVGGQARAGMYFFGAPSTWDMRVYAACGPKL